MAYRRIIAIAIVLVLVTACGRRLPEEGLDNSTADEETAVVVASPTVVENIDENTDAEVTTVPDATAEVESTSDESSEEVATEEPVAVVEAEPADDLIAIVADASASNGEALFNQMTGAGFACATCHNAANDQRLIGPGFAGLPIIAENRIEGVVAERYLYNSIIHPNDYIVEGYPEGVMPPTYSEIFSEDELNDLVAYLMTLGEMPDRSEPAVVEVEPIATEEPTQEPTGVADASTDTTDTSSSDANTIVITQIVVVTATPSAETAQEVETEVPVPTEAVDPNATPDFIVTLSSFGRISNGETLYASECLECHTLDGSGEYDLSDLSALTGSVASERYLYDALNAPDVHNIVYTETLSEIELYDLIAYLVAQSGE